MTVRISADDLGMILCSAVRYALGRRSYIVGATRDAVRTYWQSIPPDLRPVILSDIREALEQARRRGDTLGMDIDEAQWVRLLGDLTAAAKEQP